MEQIGIQGKDELLEPVGVGGWLAFLCVVLTIIRPLIIIGGAIRSFGTLVALAGSTTWAPFYLASLLALDFINVTFGLYAGIGLWRFGTNAVRVAKVFVLTSIVYPVAGWILGMMYMQRLVGPPYLRLMQAFVFVIVWVSYLENSQRVENTYKKDSFAAPA